jgi:hypothetical protein
MKQPGRPAVFVAQKSIYANHSRLPKILPGVEVLTERNRYSQHWGGGSLLVCWPTEGMLAMLSDDFADRFTAACVLEWGEDQFVRAWLRANHATDLTTGRPMPEGGAGLPTVVRLAMENLNRMVNHSNGLAGNYDKGLAIQTLTALVNRGHYYDVNTLCAWALANGFTATEVERLRDLATKAQAGHRFRMPRSAPLRTDIVEQWEAEAQGQSSV